MKNKYILFSTVISVLTLSLLFAGFETQTNSKIKTKEIKAVLEAQQNAWNEKNIEKFMQYYWNDDSLLFVTQRGATWGYKQMLAGYQKSYSTPEKIGRLDFEILRIKTIDEKQTLAHVLGKWKVSRNADTLKGYFNILFKQMPNGPKIIMDNTW